MRATFDPRLRGASPGARSALVASAPHAALAHRGARSSAVRGRRGLTLMELMLVLALVGVVLGMGLGAFATLDFSGAQAQEIVKGALRSAHNAAIARHAPASVRVARSTSAGGERATLTPRGLTVLGTWHFETEDLAGAFGIAGERRGGARLVPDGYIGRALELPFGQAASVVFPVHLDPSFDFGEGFALECALAHEGTSAHVVSLGGSLGLHARGDGVLRAWFVPALAGADGIARSGSEVVVESAPGALRVGEWTRVRASYDRHRLELLIDGVTVASLAEEAPVWPIAGPLTIGGGTTPFVGRLDNLVLSAWVEGAAGVLPEGVRLAADFPAEILFDAAGRLDADAHPAPLALGIVLADGREEVVRLSPWGTVE